VRLNPVAERHPIGEDLYLSDARISHPGVALRKPRIIHSYRLERDSPPASNGSLLDYWEACAGVLGAAEGVVDAAAGTIAARVAVAVGVAPDPQAVITSRPLTANVILMADFMS
jgi:hypothetical protein